MVTWSGREDNSARKRRPLDRIGGITRPDGIDHSARQESPLGQVRETTQ
jgi:hypothetical protein